MAKQPPTIKLPPKPQAGAIKQPGKTMPVQKKIVARSSSMKNGGGKSKSTSSAASTSSSSSSSSGTKKQEEKAFEQLPMGTKLSKVFIARLTQTAIQYNSFYIFSFEISLYEIMLVIVRLCFEGGEDRSKIASKMKSKGSSVSTDKASNKFCGLRTVLDTMRNSEIGGQLTHVIGAPQLWVSYAPHSSGVESPMKRAC